MATLEAYVLGNGVRIYGSFADVAGDPVDPTTLVLTVRKPDGTDEPHAWPGGDGVIVQDSTGEFHATVVPDAEGEWRYQWLSTGPSSAIEGSFVVYSAFTPGPSNTYTYDPTTVIGKVRLLVDDRDLTQVNANVPLSQRSAVWSDEEIQAVLDGADVGGDSNLAAARLLITLASNRNLLVQSRRIGKTTVDYGSVRSDLLRQAEHFIAQSDKVPAAYAAEHFWDDFSGRDIIYNSQLRENG